MELNEKNEIIASVSEKIKKSNALFLMNYSGVTVAEVSELRREFRKEKIEYRVFKNTLVKRAIDGTGKYVQLKDQFQGMVSCAFGYEDAVAPAKIIKKFIEKNKKMEFKACCIEDTFYPGSKLEEIALLPSKTQIIAGILGSLQSPISGIVGAINAVMRDLVGVIEAIEKKKQENN